MLINFRFCAIFATSPLHAATFYRYTADHQGAPQLLSPFWLFIHPFYRDNWDGWISFYIMGHDRGPELASEYYRQAQQSVPRAVWGNTDLLAPDDAESIGRRLRMGKGGSTATSVHLDVNQVD
jgi:hypothetical protein